MENAATHDSQTGKNRFGVLQTETSAFNFTNVNIDIWVFLDLQVYNCVGIELW